MDNFVSHMTKTMRKLLTSLIISLSTFSSSNGHPVERLIPTPDRIELKSCRNIRLSGIRESIDSTLSDEEYRLETIGRKAVLTAGSKQGLAHARATLAQLSGVCPAKMMTDQAYTGLEIPDIHIEDAPAFPIRGFMHDTGRNFREIETLKQEIDLFAFYKLNVFHWHLTDNPAWRIECRAYPQLNDPFYQRKGRDEGRFYTYDQIREVIAYARERGVMIIPEIDMPGHSQYFDRTFGFSMDSEEGMAVLETCLKEFMHEIPAEDCPYIHIGSDEVHISDPMGFMNFCEGLVKADGRIPLAWFPGLPSSESTIAQIWSDEGRKFAGVEFPNLYLDSYMGYLNLSNPLLNTSNFYLHQLCSVQEYDGKALGGILCLWNDVRVDDKSNIFPHNGMPEGLLSFAESSWKGGQAREWSDLVVFEQKIALHRDLFLNEWDMRWVANAHIPWKVTVSDVEGNTLAQDLETRGGCVDLIEICKKNGINPAQRLDVSLTTEIHVERDTTITAWVGFDSPARSNRMSDGIGEQGKWEWSGTVFANNSEILPPRPWNEPGKYRYHFHTWHKQQNEEPYTDEQFFWTREPAVVPLRSGTNTITLHCKRIFNSSIWVAAFVPLTINTDGTVSEATGIRF